MTYVSELNAQFAKEAMMCQSLDEDEVINVRCVHLSLFLHALAKPRSLSHSWATTDPNPTAAIDEHAHLVKQGEQGIARGLDPDFVQSVREMDELEGIVEPRTYEDDPEAYEGDVRAAKRARIEPAAAPAQGAAPPLPLEAPPVVQAPPVGLLSGNALESLKFLSSLRQQGGAVAKPVLAKAPAGLGSLANYGSDSD